MSLTRRDFLKASASIAAAFGIQGAEALAREGGLSVVWFQAQACTGCSVSLLNSIYYNTIDDLLLNTLDLNYHPNLMAASGALATTAAQNAYNQGNYVLVVEGGVPTGASGKYCYLWPGMTAVKAFLGILLLIGWVICLRTAFVALGWLGLTLGVALLGTAVWLLVDMKIVDTATPTALTWIALAIVGIVLGIGLSWSLIRARATGQIEVQ